MLNRDDDSGEELELQEEPEEIEEDEDEEKVAADDEGEADPPKPTGKERKATRKAEHAALVASREDARLAREDARAAREELRNIAQSMERTTRTVAAVAQNAGKPAVKPLEERHAEELGDAAGRIRPVVEDEGASVRAYHREVARINAKYSREIAEEVSRGTREQIQQNDIPRQASPEAAALLAIAPWLEDDDLADGVKRMVNRIAKKEGRDLANPKIRRTTVREAIARFGKEEGLEVNLPGAAQGPRRSPAVGGGTRGAAFAGGGAPGRPVYPDSMKRMADEHKGYKQIKDPQKRYDKFYDEVVKPELE